MDKFEGRAVFHTAMRTCTLLCVATLATVFAAQPAKAQVIFTEFQPNPTGADEGEWVEIQNTGTASVSLAGWTLNDFQGSPNLRSESPSRWAFPSTASIAAGQVLILARQAAQFRMVFPAARVAYEIEPGNMDDMGVPNLTRTGTANFALANAATGDGLVLRDGMGTIVDGVEYGNVDRPVAGIPIAMPASSDGVSFTRIRVTGSSNVDYITSAQPSPGVGIMAAGGPLITNLASSPRVVTFGDMFTVTASVVDQDGVRLVEIYLDTATSSTAPAGADYEGITMTRGATTTGTYRFSAVVNNLSATLGFNEPTNFHERFVRYFVRAEDTNAEVAVSPVDAVESPDNAHYLPTYVQNVLPRMPSSIASVREEEAGAAGPRWAGLAVRVQGTALIAADIMSPGQAELSLQDDSGAAIVVFSTDPVGFEAIQPGDVLEVTGVLTSFRGLTEIGRPLKVEALGRTAPVPTTTRTIAMIGTEGNVLEGQLVHLDDVDFVAVPKPTNWPADPNSPGSWNVNVTDGTGQLEVRVTSSCELFGGVAPQYGFHITGILTEFSGRWQIIPRSAADVVAKPAPPMPDAGFPEDTGVAARDAGSNPRADGGVAAVDSGSDPLGNDGGGCGCTTSSQSSLAAPGLFAFALLGLWARRRRSR